MTRTADARPTSADSSVLIEPDELAELLDSTPDATDGAAVLADVRWTLGGPSGRPDFEAGHIPGARFVDLEAELTAHRSGDPSVAHPGGRHPLPTAADFQAAMRRIGVGVGGLVVVYDQASSLAASRLWWLLTDAGHPQVRVLNGGFDAWRVQGHPVESGPDRAAVAGDFTARPGHRHRVEGDELAAALAEGRPPVLADVRAHPRYTGETEPMDPVAGHIPGAVSAPSPANQGPDGRFLDAERIRRRYRDLDQAGDPVFYCGSGITAAHTLLARESAGLTGGAIYAGSWSDWISDPARPVATGDGPQL